MPRRPGQLAALRWIRKRGGVAMLNMPMSAGKSRVVVDWIQINEIFTVLILCPKSAVTDVWPDQFTTHAAYPNDYLIAALQDGSVQARTDVADQVLATTATTGVTSVIVINYQAAFREPFRTWALKQQWDLVVLDESHRIKAPGGKVSFFCKALAQRAANRLCLTGTPMPHSPLDIYAQFRFLDPAVFGTRVDQFRSRYCYIGGFSGRQIIGWHNLKDLRRRYRLLAFESSEAELGLPPEQDIIRTCDLEPHARRHYTELKKDFITQTTQGIVTAKNALVKLLRFQQLTAGFFQHQDHPKAPKAVEAVSNAKTELLLDVLEDLDPKKPVVIFALFHPEIDRIKRACEKMQRPAFELSGRVNQLAKWKAGEAPILVVQIASGAESIDLTRARYAIYHSLGYSNGNYKQSRRRLRRTNQPHPVTYIHLLCRDTVDQQVRRALANGQKVVDLVLKEGVE